MKTLTEKLNFSTRSEVDRSIRITKYGNNNYYDMLLGYCKDNGIDPDYFEDDEIDDAVETMIDYGISDDVVDYYYFWID